MKLNLLLTLTLVFWTASSQYTMATNPAGPASKTLNIAAHDIDTFRLKHVGGTAAQIHVRSYGKTMVEVVVLDDGGKVVASGDDKNGGDIILAWVPDHTQTYTVKVANPAAVANVYFISTN